MRLYYIQIYEYRYLMDAYETQSEFLKAISHPVRLAILDLLRNGEQCVCHLEASLNQRQAYISQQLMILKEAGLVEPRREGLNLYYHVTKPSIFSVLDPLSFVTGVASPRLQDNLGSTACPCPKCNSK